MIIQVLKTEITRHIFDGGHLDLHGQEIASSLVTAEASSCSSFKELLGTKKEVTRAGRYVAVCTT